MIVFVGEETAGANRVSRMQKAKAEVSVFRTHLEEFSIQELARIKTRNFKL